LFFRRSIEIGSTRLEFYDTLILIFAKSKLMKVIFTMLMSACALVCSAQTQKTTQKMKLLYVYDALCGWCYGFSPVIEQFAHAHKDEIVVEVISGGMVIGDRIGPIGEVAPYIAWAYKDVERATGVVFGKHFLDVTLKNGTATFSSVPPAVAMSVFKELLPEKQLAFAARLQKAVYYDGIEPENTPIYGQLAAEFGLDSAQFAAKMMEPKYLALAEKDFALTQELQVSGFPTVFLTVGGNAVKIASGAVGLGELEKRWAER
jgi:putative protein-disulfide isomerase